jgi:nucleoside-diphosphate-sugar epimerase
MMTYKNKKVLVTGGAGFLGSHISETLVRQGAFVRIIDDLSTGSLENIKNFKDHVLFIKGSILDFQLCLEVTKSIDIIFHTAAFISVPQSFEIPKTCYDINVTGTLNLLEASRINHVERFVFSSSCAVYGTYAGICTEDLPCKPTSPYGSSKMIGEHLVRHYAHYFGLRTANLRYFNIYGERQNPHGAYAGVIAKLRHQLQHNKPLTIFGDGTQMRDFIPVHDVVQANLNIAQLPSDRLTGDAYNIGTGSSISLLDMIDILKKDFPDSTSQIQFLPGRVGDTHYSAADCTKYKKALEYQL